MTILEEIIEVKKEEVKKLKRKFTLTKFKDSEFWEKPKISMEKALSNNERLSIIAEIKKASPSKGMIREDFDHLKIADIYLENEVDAISILTDKNFFQGNIKYLKDIAKIKTAPLLRKDFIIDEYQIYEAKASGADVVLLIAEALSKNQIAELTFAAKENDLEILLELHSEEQFEKIDFSQNKIIGINNRNLKTFKVDLNTTEKLSEKIPNENLIVAESGIASQNDIDFIKQTQANAVLVGEYFMRKEKISEAVKEFKDWCFYEN